MLLTHTAVNTARLLTVIAALHEAAWSTMAQVVVVPIRESAGALQAVTNKSAELRLARTNWRYLTQKRLGSGSSSSSLLCQILITVILATNWIVYLLRELSRSRNLLFFGRPMLLC